MPHSFKRLVRTSSALPVACWLFLIALVFAGCDGPTPAGPPVPDTGPAPCVPGELTLDDGTCQPAGLPPDMPCAPGELVLEDGGTCQPAGLPPDMPCPPGETLLDDGACQKAGVPASACGEGFLPDGKNGCEPILPADPCPEGLMAVPGDTVCREVAPCGIGPWGDIPVEANTQFVDTSYAGGDSDGTQAKPWTTIQQGINAADQGAIVAVAAGTYPEDVVIQGTGPRLWGRCPAMVEVVGTGAQLGAVLVLKNGANGAEIHGIAVTGPSVGIGVSGASDVVIDSVWIHGAGIHGLNVQDDLGLTSVNLRGSLVERNTNVGVIVTGSEVTIEASVVRDTLLNAQGKIGRGINTQIGFDSQARANLTVRASLIEQNHNAGVFVGGSDATIESTVVRSTLPEGPTKLGHGIFIMDAPDAMERANVTVRSCLVEGNHSLGVYVLGSDAAIKATVVRSTLPDAQGTFGRGISISNHPNTMERASVTVDSCLVEQNHEVGVLVTGSDMRLEATEVRSNGRGVAAQDDSSTGARANVTVRACLVEQNGSEGVFILGSDATIEATSIRSTLPGASGDLGYGIHVVDSPKTSARAGVTVRACLIEQNHGLGALIAGSDATIEASLVRSNLPNAQGLFGRGIGVQHNPSTNQRADVTVRACLLEQHHENGVFVLGSDAIIESTVIRSAGPDGQWEVGRGIDVQNDFEAGERANVTVRGCLIEQNRRYGVFVLGSDVMIEATEVRSTLPHGQGSVGRGINVQNDPTNARANVTVRACLIEQNHDAGILVAGSDATLEATVVRATLPDGTGAFGTGIVIQHYLAEEVRASVVVRACVVEQNRVYGMLVGFSDAEIVDTAVRDTLPAAGDRFGDGITVFTGTAAIRNTEVTRNVRAGVASFGSHVVITGGEITCNGIDIEGDPFENTAFSFDGSTGWQCSDKAAAACTELGVCSVETTSMEPPSALPPVDPLPQ